MAGELQNNTQYLNSLQAVTDIDYIFPSTQKTLTFSVEGLATDEWLATLEYSTLIVDQVSYDRAELPIFTNSTVIGYYEGIGSASENTTGSITIPANMYSGKILPASDRYVPITIVNIKWSNIVTPTSTYSQNIAYIQQWEPGVIIGDPRDDILFEPIEPIASTLTLTGVARIVQGDTLVLTATTDIPIDIGTDNECSFFYFDGEEQVELGTALFDNTVNEATLEFVTDVLDLTTYEIFAEFGGRRNYGRTRSNGFSVEVLEGIPLLKDSELFVPSKAVYLVGDSVNYSIQVVPDPFFEPSGIEVANPVTISTIDSVPPQTSSTFFTGNFDDGAASGTFSVINSMVDTALEFEGSVWSITTSTQNSTTYTATIFVQNTETVRVAWGYQTLGQYARGSTTTNIQVGTTVTRTVLADPFPIVIDHSPPNSLQEEPFEISVATTFTSYENDITVIATNIADGTTSTLFSGNNSGTSTFVFPVILLNTGTYTIVASYPGDIGKDIYSANQAAVSNQLTHVIRPGNDLDARFVFYTTETNDVLRVWADTSTTLTQTVSFYEDAELLGTANWSRQFVDYTVPISTVYKAATTGTSLSFADNFSGDSEFNLDPNRNRIGYGWTSPNNDNNYDLTLRTQQDRFGWTPISDRLYNNSADLPGPILHNRYRLFKYYDGTNYDLSETEFTKGANIADPVTFDYDWNIRIGGYRTYNLNSPFMNANTTFYNYIESRFGYAAMLEYLSNVTSVDGSPLKLNNLKFNDRPTGDPGIPVKDWGDPGSAISYDRYGSPCTALTFPLYKNATLQFKADLTRSSGFTQYPTVDIIIRETNPNGFDTYNTINLTVPITPTGRTTGITQFQFLDINDVDAEGRQYYITIRYKQFNGGYDQWFFSFKVFPKNAVVYTVNPNYGPVQVVKVPLYDVHRIDTIGDSRGYNVVGINANSGFVLPTVSESDPTRLYFMGANNKERYIDLVEYIGETEWDKPIETTEQKAGTRPRSRIKVWLFRFTPTIPQANTEFRTQYEQTSIIDLIPTNNWLSRPLPGWPDDYYVNSQINRYGVDYFKDVNFPNAEYYATLFPGGIDANFASARDDYRIYGKKTWFSANLSDPVENDKAAFYNDWYKTFTIPTSKVYTKNVFTTTYETLVSDSLQNATLVLSEDTVIDPAALTASWPGTRYLSAEFGKFNPFALTPTTSISQLSWSVNTINTASIRVPATKIYATNQVELKVNLVTEPPDIIVNTGTVTLINNSTGISISTGTVSGSEAKFTFFSTDLVPMSSAPFLNLKARYNDPNFVETFTDNLNIQAINPLHTHSQTFNNNEATWFNIKERIPTPTFRVSQFRLNGYVDYTLPFFNGTNPSSTNEYQIIISFNFRAPNGSWAYRYVRNPSTQAFYWPVIKPSVQTDPNFFRITFNPNAIVWNFSAYANAYFLSTYISSNGSVVNGSKVLVNAANIGDNLP